MSREKLYEAAREAYSRAKFYNLEEPVKAAVDAVLANQPTIRVVESPPVERKATEADIEAHLLSLGATKEWRCENENNGDTICVSPEDAHHLNTLWPNTRPHDDCGWVIVWKVEGQ